jgi:probable HAF family extracellular repeat protein
MINHKLLTAGVAMWLAVGAASAGSPKPVGYSATLVANALGGVTSYHGGGGINNQGTVVGAAYTAEINGVERPFIARPGSVMRDLGTLPGDGSGCAYSINNEGQAVGESLGPQGMHAILWRGRGPENLGSLPGYSSAWAWAINNKGQVAGVAFRQLPGGNAYTQPSTAFLWDHGRMLDLGCLTGYSSAHAVAINDRGQVAGWAINAAGKTTAVFWDHGKIVDLGQRTHRAISEATGINNQGEVVGDSGNSTDDMRATIWSPSGQISRAGLLPYAHFDKATAVNDDGLVIGNMKDGPDLMSIFTWDKQAGLRGVISLMPPSSGSLPLHAFAVSDAGRILAWGDFLNQSEQICVLTPFYSPVPAPANKDNLLVSTADFDHWRMPTNGGAIASLSEDNGAIKCAVYATDGTDWHVSCMQRNIDLKENERYILAFRAKADNPRKIRVTAVLEESDYNNLGLDRTLTLSRSWQAFKLVFTAHNTLTNLSCIPNFMFGQATGQVWIDRVSLLPVTR